MTCDTEYFKIGRVLQALVSAYFYNVGTATYRNQRIDDPGTELDDCRHDG